MHSTRSFAPVASATLGVNIGIPVCRPISAAKRSSAASSRASEYPEEATEKVPSIVNLPAPDSTLTGSGISAGAAAATTCSARGKTDRYISYSL
jgi:hypothetical protein